LVTQYSQID